jgi:hypothetical protein
MKAKVIIENGETTIVLNPENEFEKDIIEKVRDRKDINVSTFFEAEYSFGMYNKQKIQIKINDKPK